MYIDFIIKAFLWICCLFSRSSGFRICQSSSSKTEKLSCISRASCAQAPRKQKNAFGWSKEGDPRTDDHFLGKKARIAVKEREKKARSDVMSRSSSSTSSSDSSDWKKSAQVRRGKKVEAWVVLFADLMIVRQVCFLFTRRGVTQGNALFGRFWEQAFRQTVIYFDHHIPYWSYLRLMLFPQRNDSASYSSLVKGLDIVWYRIIWYHHSLYYSYSIYRTIHTDTDWVYIYIDISFDLYTKSNGVEVWDPSVGSGSLEVPLAEAFWCCTLRKNLEERR